MTDPTWRARIDAGDVEAAKAWIHSTAYNKYTPRPSYHQKSLRLMLKYVEKLEAAAPHLSTVPKKAQTLLDL